MKKVNWMMAVFAMMVTLASCGKYEEGGFGSVGVVKMGAFVRSEGGGVQPNEKWPGTNLITKTGTSYTMTHKFFTPRTITLADLPVIMVNMDNQQLTFTPSLTYMTIPGKMPILFENFKSANQEIKTIFNQACLEILGRLEMGIDLDEGKKKKKGISFDNREEVAQKIMVRFKKGFKNQYPEFVSCFIFMDVAVGNVDFNEKVLEKLEQAVAKEYETERLNIEAKSRDLQGQIEVAKSDADLEAYGQESGALDDDVLSYMGIKLVDEFTANDHINTVVVIPLDDDGNISWLKADHKK